MNLAVAGIVSPGSYGDTASPVTAILHVHPVFWEKRMAVELIKIDPEDELIGGGG